MSIVRGLLWSYVERWGNKIISLLVFIILARLLDPKDFGLVALAKLFIDYADSVAGQGLGFAIIQRKEINDEHLNTAFWVNVFSSLALVLLIGLLAPIIATMFSEPGVIDVLRALAVIVVISSLSRVQVAILTRAQQFNKLAVRGLIMAMVGGAVGIGFAAAGFGVWSLVYQQIATAVVALILLWGIAEWRPKFSFSMVAIKQLYGFASKVVLDQQILYFSRRLDEALIGALLGATLLGYYSIAKRLFETLADLVFSVLTKVLLAAFSKTQDDIAALCATAEKVIASMAAVSFPLFLAAGAASGELIQIVFGEKWLAASAPFSLLMVAALFLLTPTVLHPVFHAVGKPGIPLQTNVGRAVASAVGVSIGSALGIAGVAGGVLVRNAAGAWLDVRAFKQVMGRAYSAVLRPQLAYATYCLPMVLTMIGLSLLLGSHLSAPTRLLVMSAAGFVAYAGMLAGFKAQALRDAGSILINAIQYVKVRAGKLVGEKNDQA